MKEAVESEYALKTLMQIKKIQFSINLTLHYFKLVHAWNLIYIKDHSVLNNLGFLYFVFRISIWF